MTVTPEIKARLEKLSNMPTTAFVCYYLLNGKLYSEASAIDRAELAKLMFLKEH